MKYWPLAKRTYETLPTPDFETLLDRFFEWPFKAGIKGFGSIPAVDVYEKRGKVMVKAEVAGIEPEDVKLALDGKNLTIRGEKKTENEVKREDYYQVESLYGTFQRTVELPWEVKADSAKAAYKDGVLNIELDKSDSPGKKEIKIEKK